MPGDPAHPRLVGLAAVMLIIAAGCSNQTASSEEQATLREEPEVVVVSEVASTGMSLGDYDTYSAWSDDIWRQQGALPQGWVFEFSSPEEAESIIRRAPMVTSSAIGLGARRTAQYEAYEYLVGLDDAAERFGRLIHESSLPGQMYALAGLCALDPEAFERHKPAFMASDRRVYTMVGCSGGPTPIQWIVEDMHVGNVRPDKTLARFP